MGNAQRVRNANAARQTGELARLKVVQGPDYGSAYVVTGHVATIGRGEECDIQLSDLKASRRHAEILVGQQGWAVRDHSSANGIKVNGSSTRLHVLKQGDTIALGETVLEFFPAEAETKMLVAPAKTPAQARLQASRGGVSTAARGGVVGSVAGPAFANPRLLLLAVGAIAVFVFLGGDPPTARSIRGDNGTREEESRSPASPYVPATNAVAARTIEAFFKTGYREYREKNWLRARAQFENVLQVSPGHPMALHYLEACDQAVRLEIKNHLEMGKKSVSSGKLKSARGHFEAVMRLLFRDKDNADFIEAKEQLEKVNAQISGPSGASANGDGGGSG